MCAYKIIRRRGGALCALVLALAALTGRLEAADWERITQIGAEDFLSNVITAVERDEFGRVWWGTDRGLAWTADGGRTWTPVRLDHAQPRIAGRRTPMAPLPALTGEALARRSYVTAIAGGRNGIWVATRDGLCFGTEDLETWDYFGPENGGPGPEVWAVTEYQGEVWASAVNGVFKSNNSGAQWQRIAGNFPPRISSIALQEDRRTRSVWLAGFDAAPRYGGGPEILRSVDGGKTWDPIKTETASGIARAVSTRANRVAVVNYTLWACTRHGLARSMDGGEHWTPIRPRTGLDAEEIYDIALWGTTLWVATSEGLYFSSDNGDTWKSDARLRGAVYDLAPDNRLLWLATHGGVLSRSSSAEWRTFSARSNILALAQTTVHGQDTWWAGTTGGLLHSRDQGKTWRTLTVADGLPSNLILSLASDGERVWAGTDGGVWQFTENTEATRRFGKREGLHGLVVRDLFVDGRDVWAATDRGLSHLAANAREWRTHLSSRSWRAVCAVTGNDGKAVLYGASNDPADGQGERMAVFSSPLENEKWRTLHVPGHDGAAIHQLLPVGDDIWMASDTGLFRTRDGGETWARFGNGTLWSERVTRLCRSGSALFAQSVPSNPPSLTAFLNVTRDGGRSWSVLGAALPGHADALLVSGDQLLCGSNQRQFGPTAVRGALAICAGYQADLRPAHAGWHQWNRVAALAAAPYRPDRLGAVSGVDRYAPHGPALWLGSPSAGAVRQTAPTVDPQRRAWDITGNTPLSIAGFALLQNENITAFGDAPEGMWIGTTTGLHLYDRFDRLQTWRSGANALSSTPVRAIQAVGQTVWVGTDTGLNVFDRVRNAWRYLRKDNADLPDDRITCLGYDGEVIWGGTRQGGFVVEADGTVRTLSTVPTEVTFTGVAIGAERQYFASNFGIYVLDREGVRKRHLHSITSALIDNNVSQVFLDGPSVWAATPRGIVRLPIDPPEPWAPAPAPSSRGPEGVLVVANARSSDSLRVAEEYCRVRQVPPGNLCRIDCPTEETVPRKVFEDAVRAPIRQHLIERGLSQRISFIVLVHGVPLRIAPTPPDPGDEPVRIEAGVDSELTLLARPFPVAGGVPNPYLHRDEAFNSTLFGMFLVTRIDGPTPEAALNIIHDSAAIEEDRSFGGRGFARFDLHPLQEDYAERLNNGILANYALLRRQERLHGRVVPPEHTLLPLYREGAGLNTIFYIGWGNHAFDPQVFSWIQGAVVINLDPLSAPSLRSAKDSWLAGALAARPTAAIGSVYDPGPDGYLSTAHVFRYMKAGYTWAETAYMSIPQLSWQTVVIGDPLYTPMK